MNDEIEPLLGRLKPRGVGPELRPQVLAAVASRLEAESASPWLRRSALAVAATLLVGIALNVWVSDRSERRLAQLFGPTPVPKQVLELADAVQEITDTQTAQWIRQRFAASRPSGKSLAAYASYNDMLRRLLEDPSALSKDPYDETPQEDRQMDRDRAGRAGGDRSGCQRRIRLDYRCTA